MSDEAVAVDRTEIARLVEAYVMIEDPFVRDALLSLVESVAQADCDLGPYHWRPYRKGAA